MRVVLLTELTGFWASQLNDPLQLAAENISPHLSLSTQKAGPQITPIP